MDTFVTIICVVGFLCLMIARLGTLLDEDLLIIISLIGVGVCASLILIHLLLQSIQDTMMTETTERSATEIAETVDTSQADNIEDINTSVVQNNPKEEKQEMTPETQSDKENLEENESENESENEKSTPLLMKIFMGIALLGLINLFTAGLLIEFLIDVLDDFLYFCQSHFSKKEEKDSNTDTEYKKQGCSFDENEIHEIKEPNKSDALILQEKTTNSIKLIKKAVKKQGIAEDLEQSYTLLLLKLKSVRECCECGMVMKKIEYLNKYILSDVINLLNDGICTEEVLNLVIEACNTIINAKDDDDKMRSEIAKDSIKAALTMKGLIKEIK